MSACPKSSWMFCVALLLMTAQCWAAPQYGESVRQDFPANFKIAGTVVSKADGHLLSRARVTVRDTKDAKKFATMLTAEDGRYEFGGLPAGKYSPTGSRKGFITASYDQHEGYSTAIVTGAGIDTEKLFLRLAPDAVIAGKVLDESNEPVRHAQVTLYFDDHSSGVDEIHQYRSAQTNDLGEYEMTPLQPGTYFLSASGKPWYAVHPRSEPISKSGRPVEVEQMVDRSLDVAYPVTYYPDVTEADDAMPIAIMGGERVQADIHFTPVPSLRLRFRTGGDGKNGYAFPQLEQTAFYGSSYLQTGGANVVSPGIMEITGVPAGRYNVHLRGAGEALQMNGVDFTKDGEEIDVSKSEPVSEVKFSVQIPGDSSLPSRLMVGLRSQGRSGSFSGSVDAKGETKLEQTAAGRYEVVVYGGQKPYSIAHMRAEGAQVAGHTLTVLPGSSPTVTLTLVGGSVEVDGIATRAGKGLAGAMVVLVPKDAELDRDLFRRDQSDLDGTFVMRGVVPGSYTLLAIENGWDLDWAKPGVIGVYLKHGRKIEVGSQSWRPMNVKDGVEVQSK
jgi:hypothetical protein